MGFDQIKVELCSHWGGDRDAANAAWASTFSDTSKKTAEDVSRVVTGLVHHHHDTPKERLWLEFFITCPIYIERQIDKYRMTLQYQDFQLEWLERPMGGDHITQNELSGRYRTIPDRAYKLPDDVNTIIRKTDLPAYFWDERLAAQHRSYQVSLESMKRARADGKITQDEYKRAREVLRGELGTAYLTDMRLVLNMNAFEHIINQRLAKEAQLESRVVAFKMVKALRETPYIAPILIEEMVVANGWMPLLEEIRALLEAETPKEQPPSRSEPGGSSSPQSSESVPPVNSSER